MKPTLRASTFAIACVLAIACGPALAQIALDTASLPRPGGGKSVYASAPTTIFTSADSVALTIDATRKALNAAGWQNYEPPFTSKSNDPNSRIMSFKKASQGLTVFITVAPAQNNATSVQYNAIGLETDLPFPRDATDIEYSPQRPQLNCFTDEPVEKTLAFFGSELAAQGWSAWSTKDVAKIPAGEKIGVSSDKGAYATFVRDGKPPIRLTLFRTDKDKTQVEIAVIPAEDLNPQIAKDRAIAAQANEAAQKAAAQDAAKARIAQSNSNFDNISADIMKQAQRATADALAGAKAPPAAPPKLAENEKPLQALTGAQAPVPLPGTAEQIDFRGEDGRLEYQSPSSVAAIAEFHRAAMKPLGWKEQKSVINRANMVVLDFQKDRKKLSFTIMQMGANVNVSGSGSGLKTIAADDAPQKATASKSTGTSSSAELEADDTDGFPLPKERTATGNSQTPFRLETTATISAGFNPVLAFYKRELAKKNWTEEPGADVKADHAKIRYSTAEGPAVLTIDSKKRNETEISMAIKKKAEAAKSGLLPKPGQVKLLLGNVLDTASVVTINKNTISVAAGAGKKPGDGPSLELPPGKYKYTIKSGAKAAQNGDIEVGADEIWGLLVGPGGGLPLQMY